MENRSLYKTAEELQIQPWEHDALVALVGPLSRGELAFSMHESNHINNTAYCIGGYVDSRNGARKWAAPGSSVLGASEGGSLHKLYYEFSGSPNSSQAARAVVNFLVTGAPSWNAVMAEAV